MNTPTEAQLNDPKWWDENAGTATHYCPANRQFYDCRLHPCCISRAIKPKSERLAQHLAERDAFLAEDAEPQPEQDPIADRIMELGNQVHNLACEAQNDEALAGELADIRGRLWDLGGKVRKAREREREAREREETIEVAMECGTFVSSDSEANLLAKFARDLYDAGMLRKGEK